MRYSDTHKEETRKKVVTAAAGAVRAKGPDGVGVAEIMAQVGLTHGGFYAHFPNKEALVAAAITEAFGQGRQRFGRLTDGMSPAQALEAFIDAYVSEDHRAYPVRGCPLTALSNDMPRQGEVVRQAFDAGVQGMIARLVGWLPDTLDRDELASSLVAEMAGAVALSRAVSDPQLAARLLRDSRQRIKARAGLSDMETDKRRQGRG
jgi:TetR/AcrR family transcriptional repressor of nem operon